MRGVIAAGGVLALERIGNSDIFDSFYGMSAGAITAAYFAAGQSILGTSIFYDNLASNRFIDIKRALAPRKSIMNLSYLEEVILDDKKLHGERVASKDLNIYGLNIETAETELFQKPGDNTELARQLVAACTMPFLGHYSTVYRGKHYIDAGLGVSVPWKQALEDGCTHILVLLTRPPDSPRPALRKLEKIFIGNNLAKKNPRLVPMFLERAELYNENIEELYQNQASHNIAIFTPPPGERAIRSMEKSRDRLLGGGITGAAEMYRYLFGSRPQFTEIIQPIEHGRFL